MAVANGQGWAWCNHLAEQRWLPQEGWKIPMCGGGAKKEASESWKLPDVTCWNCMKTGHEQ